LSSVFTFSATPRSCRFQAAEVVVEDLNKNGKLWSAHQRKTGEVEIRVIGGKVWLNLADEEVFLCDPWAQSVCVDSKFQDPETNRVEHQVMVQLDKRGCIARVIETSSAQDPGVNRK
jgi:hypothetical protein